MKIILLFLLLTCIASCQKNGPDNPVNTADNFIRAADLSALPEIEQAGTQFYASDNQPKDALTILKESGCNTIRLRLCITLQQIIVLYLRLLNSQKRSGKTI
jgi:arabinogalactan endo-1,4-beta-galactosidase